MIRRAFVVAALAASAPASAQSLSCVGRDAQMCDFTNGIAEDLNAQVGSPVIAPGVSRAALRPANVYSALLGLRTAIDADCDVVSYASGVYDVSASVQAWSGTVGVPTLGDFPTDGTCVTGPGTWSGEIDYSAGPGFVAPVGDVVGLHNSAGQIVANIEEESFQAGFWYRVSGNRGVWVALLGTCASDPADALDPWYAGTVPSFQTCGDDFAWGGTPYLSFADSPFAVVGFSDYFHLDDFEGAATPGYSLSTAGTLLPSTAFGPGLVDSVDLDDGLIDGACAGCEARWANAPVTITFDDVALGGYPTHVGVALTDHGVTGFVTLSSGDACIEATSIPNFGDASVAGETAEDRFIGLYYEHGIESVTLGPQSAFEFDHVQYGR